jgi:dipeptidase E
MKMRTALLISNSTAFGRGYLDHVAGPLCDVLGERREVLFFPYAVFDRTQYAARAKERLAALGRQLVSIHEVEPGKRRRAVVDAKAFFIGGGNTFRLLHALYQEDLLEPIRERVRAGVPYIGSSAGAIVAGPTIMTTKDMPIVQPCSFAALSIFPYQISPHYLDPDPNSRHMGETQEERILQFLEENETPVIGLREGSWIRQHAGAAILEGPHSARVFQRGRPPDEIEPGSCVTVSLGGKT